MLLSIRISVRERPQRLGQRGAQGWSVLTKLCPVHTTSTNSTSEYIELAGYFELPSTKSRGYFAAVLPSRGY